MSTVLQQSKPTQSKANRTKEIKEGFLAAVPLIIGYLPVAFTFGLIAKQADIDVVNTLSFSALVYAGASQFMGLSMYLAGVSFFQIYIATFILNFRNFVMSLSFNHQFKTLPFWDRVYLSITLTDENFAVTTLGKKNSKTSYSSTYLITLHTIAYITWISGTILGVIFSKLIPKIISESMGISLYAMFIGLLTPAIRTNWRACVIVLVSMLLNFFFSTILTQGWSLILSSILASFLAIGLMRGDSKE
ncbi:AzlC family ABC transporter permease [Bacillus sp. AFS017336]|uniref:AzlC family ABC transporter permease n=1 Tax=Bacillus sp. AFS017336 TaxID=2033489 RepID=UPI000BF22125|nr:AzlC family ABC transporter permease [Bacillus sp. AFS017336]PEL12709.1 branched-chain amino acid transporter AzlC [Bacillus sp. AFS017336]